MLRTPAPNPKVEIASPAPMDVAAPQLALALMGIDATQGFAVSAPKEQQNVLAKMIKHVAADFAVKMDAALDVLEKTNAPATETIAVTKGIAAKSHLRA